MFNISESWFCRNLDNIQHLTYNEDANFSLGIFCFCRFGYSGVLAFSVKDRENKAAAMESKQLYLLYKLSLNLYLRFL